MIYDTFLFFNEFDLLDIRLHELSDMVGRFVLLESNRTFTNRPKPLYFQEYTGNRFDEFRDRIEVITLDDFRGVDVSDPWAIEAHHRNYLFSRLECKPDDVVMLSDADEIPSAEFVRMVMMFKGNGILKQWKAVRGSATVAWYWLNCVRSELCYGGTRATVYGEWKWSGQQLRKFDCTPLHGSMGWHLSYMTDVQTKLAAFAHTELNQPPFNTPEHIERCKADFTDLFNRGSRYGVMSIRPDLSHLPKYVQNHPERFSHLMCKQPTEATLEITTIAGCRVNCEVCPQSVFLKAYRGERLLDFETFRTCLDKVPAWVQIDFSGFAEPWLNPQCTDMLEYAAQRHLVNIYTTLVGMTRDDALRLACVSHRHLGIHIRDIEDKSPIHTADLSLIADLRPDEFISHGPPHPDVVPYLTPGVPVAQPFLNSHGSNNWEVPRRMGPIRCRSTRRHRHNVLLPDGDVVFCCMDFGMRHRLGNLLTDSYESLFAAGGEYDRIQQLARTQDGDFICRRCELAEGIPA